MKQGKLLPVLFTFCFMSIILPGQELPGFIDQLSEKFARYCKTFPREEIFIHTDKDEYIAGEELWLKIYLFDRQSSRPLSDSRIAYFELLNSDNRPVIQKRFRLNNGSGPGMVLLPDTLSSGSYMIRAYTNWMKNFLPSNSFMKRVVVFNALSSRDLVNLPDPHAIVNDEVKSVKSTALSGSGITIKADYNQPGSLGLMIETDRNFRLSNGTRCYIFVQTRGNINFTGTLELTSEVSRITVPVNMLTPGINQVTIFSQSGRPVAEKYIYTPEPELVSVKLSAPASAGRREQISVEIDPGIALDNISGPGSVSISVAQATDSEGGDIAGYMLFGSEFGYVPEGLMTSDQDRIPKDLLESFLSTLKSNWIDWNVIITGNYPVLKYARETRYHFLGGRVMNSEPQSGAMEDFLFLSSPGKKAVFQYAECNTEGYFQFRLPIDDVPRELIIQPEYASKGTSIRLESPWSEVYPDPISGQGKPDAGYISVISRQGANYQIKKIYGIGLEGITQEKTSYSPEVRRFYGKPDIELKMDDYIKLPVMQEVFFELLPGVFLKKRKSDYEITIMDPVARRLYDKPPVLFVDGVVIHDAGIIANLDPETVEQIDVIKDRYMIGDYLFFGIVNVITRAGDFSQIDLPGYASRMSYRVVDHVNDFVSPDYNNEQLRQSRLPDFRNTLYWNPAVFTDKPDKTLIEFWSSDFSADYIINLEGLAPDGKPVSVKKRFRVE